MVVILLLTSIKGENHGSYFDYFVPLFGENRQENCSFRAVKCKYLAFVSSKRILKCFCYTL